jgi:hypothetical protein
MDDRDDNGQGFPILAHCQHPKWFLARVITVNICMNKTAGSMEENVGKGTEWEVNSSGQIPGSSFRGPCICKPKLLLRLIKHKTKEDGVQRLAFHSSAFSVMHVCMEGAPTTVGPADKKTNQMGLSLQHLLTI